MDPPEQLWEIPRVKEDAGAIRWSHISYQIAEVSVQLFLEIACS
jgi:hypothetical protein